MNCSGEFEPGLMAMEGSDHEAFNGINEVSQMRSTHRDDGSLVVLEPGMEATLLEALGLSDERREKLLKLKTAIDGGRYYVSASDVAERLMASMMLV